MTIILFIVLLCVPAIFSLLQTGFFLSDDGEWMIIRFAAFYQVLSDGQLPVRFLGTLNHGYGYPVANFLYPGFMYLGVAFKLLGFGFVDSVKIILFLSIIGSAIFCYFWLSKLFDRVPSFVGAVFYVYTPYHLYDLYKRGSVGEILALAVVPFILWQIERRSVLLSSLGLGFLILSHNTLAVLFFGFFILYAGLDFIVSKKRNGILKFYFKVILFGIGIASFFWIPALLELQYTVFSITGISNWSEYFADIKLIGASIIVVLIFTAALLMQNCFVKNFVSFWRASARPESKSKEDPGHGSTSLTTSAKMTILTVLMFAVGLISLFFSTQFSSFLWNILPVSFIQFPFRLLSVTILCVAFLTAFAISVFPKAYKVYAGAGILILAFCSSWSYMFAQQHFDKGDDYYATNQDTTTVKNEYMPAWVKEKPTERFEEKLEIIDGKVGEYSVSSSPNSVEFEVNALSDMRVRINTIYYPGWVAKLDNKELKIDYSNEKGVMDIEVPIGRHKGEILFKEDLLRIAADLISLVSILTLLSISFRDKIKILKFNK